MMMRLRLSFFELLLLAGLTVLCQAQFRSQDRDRSRNYCRLWRHASVLAGSKIYIDGGNAMTPWDRDGGSSNGSSTRWSRTTNNNLLVLDVSKNFSAQDPRLFRQIRKTDTSVPRALNEHALWFSKTTNKIYQVGGWASSLGDRDRGFSNPTDAPNSGIWQFDVTSERWDKADEAFEMRNIGAKLERPGAAAYCDAPSLGVSFMFEGYVQQKSDKEYASFAPFSEFKYVSGMLALDTSEGLTKPRLSNISTPRSLDGEKTPFGPRMNGGMVHIPVGAKGILVNVGGHTSEEPTQYGTRVPGANTKSKNIDLSFVDIYDISSGFWFRQQTFGIPNIPSGRSDFCLTAVSAPDHSSHNIYMVSGMENAAERTTKSEIWVLTLPSFNWVLIDDKAQSVFGHTCHVIGDNLIVIGGMDSSRGERRGGSGELQQCDDRMLTNVFSLRTGAYVGDYDAAGVTRQPQIPVKVVEAVGGSATGGAHVRSPRIWSDTYLQYVFNPELIRPEYKPSYKNADGSDPPGETVGGLSRDDEQSKKRAIVGVVVGTVFGGILLIACVATTVVLLRRKKRKDQEDAADSEGQKLDDLHRQQQQQQQQHLDHHQHHEAELPAYSSDKNRLVELAAPPPPSEVEGCPGHVLSSDLSRPTTAHTGNISMDSGFLSPQSVTMSHDRLSGNGSDDMVASAVKSDKRSWRSVGGESPPPLPEKSFAMQRQRSKSQSVASSIRSKKSAMQNHGFL